MRSTRDLWPLAFAKRVDMVTSTVQPESLHAFCKRLTMGLLLAAHVFGVHASAAERAGGLVAWGLDSKYHPAWVHPDATRGVVAVAAAEGLTIALKEDGSVVAWGSSRRDLSPAFSGLPPMASVAAGGSAILLSRGGRIFQRWRDGTDVALPFPPEGFVAIAAGWWHQLALRVSGEVVGWGANESGEATAPEGLKDVQAIAAGYDHSVALRKDGTVVAWGSNVGGQTLVPHDLSRVIAIAAGHRSTVALRDDGTVATWGEGISQPPAGLSGVTAIAAGWGRALAVRQDGTVVSWNSGPGSLQQPPADLSGVFAVAVGGPSSIALGDVTLPVIEEHPTAASVPPWQTAEFRVRARGFGLRYQWLRDGQPIRSATNATLTIAGTFVCNAGGQYMVRVSNGFGSVSSEPAALTIVPDETPRTLIRWGNVADRGLAEVLLDGDQELVAVSVGGAFFHPPFYVGLRKEGTVVAWGSDERISGGVPVGLTEVQAVAAGAGHAVALTRSGRVAVWGSVQPGGLIPERQLSGVTAVAAGSEFTLALKSNGDLVEFGMYAPRISDQVPPGRTRLIAASGIVGAAVTDDGRLVVQKSPEITVLHMPVISNAPARLPNAVQIAVSDGVGCALNANGTLQVWAPTELVGNERLRSITDGAAIAVGETSILILRKNGSLLHVGAFGESQLEPPYSLRGVLAISANGRSAAAIGRADPPQVEPDVETRLISQWQTEKLSVEASGFGLNFLWYHGDRALFGETNTTLVLPSLRQADSGDYSVRVSNPAGSATHRVATLQVSTPTEPGTLITWGAGTQSLLQGTGERARVPERLTNVRHISAGGDHDAAVLGDGSVRSWGQSERYPILKPPMLSGITAVAASHDHAVALVRDGTVTCWGNDSYRQCNVPAGLTDVVSVAAGPGVSMALRRDGTLAAWGNNWELLHRAAEELGPLRAIAMSPDGPAAFLQRDGTVVAWDLRAVQTGIYDAVAISMGTEHLLALTREGQVRTWTPPNTSGVGRGHDTGAARVPEGLTNVVAVAAGAWFSLALKADGTVAAWGEMTTLGHFDGESPEPPTGLAGVTAIAAGETHALALVGPAPFPTLRMITRSGGASIQWPIGPLAYRLETADRFNSAAWHPVVGTHDVVNGWNQLSISVEDETRFYRLSLP